MADNTISFEITANTKQAGKQLLELSKLINKAITQETKGSDKGVIQQQKEYKKLGVEINNVWKDVKRLNEEDKKKGGKAQLPFTQYAANEKKIADLEKQISDTKDLDKRAELTAKLNDYKRKNATMDKYAEQVLKQLLGTDKAIVKDEQSILGIRTEQVNKAKQTADSTKSSADAEENLNKQTKNATNSLNSQAKAAEKANDALNKTSNKANKKTPEEKRAEKLAEVTEKVKGLSGIIDNILSKEFGGSEKFNFDQFDRARISLEALRDMLKDLGIPTEFKEDYNRIQQALDKIALGRRMLTKENNAANKQPVIPVKQLEDEAAAYEQRLYELKEKTQHTLSQMMDTSGLDYDGLKRRQEDLKAIKKAMEELHIPKELGEEYRKVTEELLKLGVALSNFDKQVKDSEKQKGAKTQEEKIAEDAKKAKEELAQLVERARAVNSALKVDPSSLGMVDLLRMLQEAKSVYSGFGKLNFPSVATPDIANTINDIQTLKTLIREYGKETENVSSKTKDAKNSGVSFGKTVSVAVKGVKAGFQVLSKTISSMVSLLKKFSSIAKSGFSAITKSTNKVKSSFDSMARNMRSNFKHLLTSITKYVFGFRSLFFLVRRLRKYLGEGIQNLVRFQGGDNRLNEWISRLLSSLLFLKNAWAAAFEPIITAVAPILERLIDMVAQAGNAVARFIGFLTGKQIVFNAVKVSAGNYAESLDGVGDSAGGAAEKVKKLNDRLADFDDLDVLGKDNDDDGTGTGGGGGGGAGDASNYDDMFEIVDAQSDLAQMIIDAWKKADFTEVGKYVRDKIYNALMGIDWDFIQEIARKVAKSFGTFLNGLLGDPKLWVAIGHTIAEALNTITYAIDEFLLTIKDTDFGGSFAQGINRMFTDIDWETIKSNIINFFDTLKNNIKSFLAGLNWEDTFVSAESGIPGEGQAQTGILTAVKTLFEGIGTAIQSVIGDSEFMGEIGTALGNLINAIIVAWQAVCETTDGTEIGNAILEFFKRFFATVKLDILADDITNTINGIVDMLVAQLEGMDGKEMGQTIWDFFERVIDNLDAEDLGKVISQSLVLGLDLITKISEEIAKPENSEKIEEKLKEFIKGLDLSTVFEALGENITASTSAVSSIAATITTVIGSPEVRQAVEDGICALIMSLDIDTIATSVGHVGSAILAAIFEKDLGNPEDLTFLDTLAQNLFDGLLISIDRVLTGGRVHLLMNAILGIKDEVAENTDEDSPWYEVATNIVTGLFKGISKALDEQFKNSPFEIIIIEIKKLFKIESPSKVMEEIGEFIVEGLVNGINNLIDTVMEPFNKLKDDLILAWDNLKTDAEEKWGLVKDAITGAVETVQTDVEEKWGLIETAVTTAWDNVSTKTQEVWDGMKTKITEEVIPAISEFITTNLPTIVTTIQTNWETIRTNTEEKWELVKGYVIDKFGEAKANLEENLPLFQEFVSTKWEEMSENARLKWDEIKSSIKDKFREAKDDVVNKARELYNKVSGYWDDLKRATYDKFTQIKTSIVNIFEALSRAIKDPLNHFITAIENMVNFAIDGINLLMDALQALMDLGDEALSALGLPEINVTHLEHVSLPRLAQGAVIPPNNEFLAVLGDQSHGTNIEAPLDTIKQAVAEVLANNGNEEVIELLQQLIRVVESKNLTIGDKDIGKANARYTNKQNIIRGTSF